MRLIDKDELLNRAEEYLKKKEQEAAYTGNRSISVCWDDAISLIDKAELVESLQIRGEWNCSDDMWEYGECSVCEWDSNEPWEYVRKRFKYCPNCGARMFEEEHTMEEFMYGQDLGSPEDGSL